MKPHTAFFGEGEHAFLLTHAMIHELERATETGVGALFSQIQKGTYTLAELLHTIRLALIGGGTSPADADRLVTTYSPATPISELFVLALSIMSLAFFGPADEAADD